MKYNRELSLGFITFIFISFFNSISIFSQHSFPFCENKGQLPNYIFSKVDIPSGSLYFQKNKIIYNFYDQKQLQKRHDLINKDEYINAHSLSVEFLNSNNESNSILKNKSNYFENYYLDNISVNQVYFFDTLIHENIYEGIDYYIYPSKEGLKYDWRISPKTSPNKIKLKYTGQDNIFLKSDNLIIKTSLNIITEIAPIAYQFINGERIEVECKFKLKNNIISYDFPNLYDKNEELIIDPVLIFSTYSGSTTDNFGYTATYDRYGFLYSGSTVFGVGYPTTIGAYQINYANNNVGTDIAITKYDSTGTQRIYSTYLGGSLDELPHSMIVNNLNELFIFGTTGSSDYPVTTNCIQSSFNGGNSLSPSGLGVTFPNGTDLIISRLSSDGGILLSSTYLGGSGNDGLNTAQKLRRNYADEVRGEIDIDKNNNIYIASCTYSNDFPANSIQKNNNGFQDGCIIKVDNQLSTIFWSTYLGGSNDDAIYSLALDENNNIFVTGGTNSSDFPVSSGAYQNTYQDSIRADAFISHISSDGTSILNSTFFGSDQYDQSYFVELNSNEEVYILGQTKSLGMSLVKNANYFTPSASQFISIFSNDLTELLRSTVVGTGKGSPDISPTAFLVDVCNNIYISGWGSNTGNGPLSTLNMPITSNAYQSSTDGNDFYIMVINDNLDSLTYGSYFGGSQSAEHVDGGTSRFDKKGVIYQSVCAGCGGNNDFPILPNPGAVSSINNSTNCNNGVFKFDFNFPIIISDFDAPYVGCNNRINFTNFTNNLQNSTYLWDFGDGNFSNDKNPTHQYFSPGIYNVKLISSSINSCNISDTIVKQIYILSNSSSELEQIKVCKNESIQIGIIPINQNGINYYWEQNNINFNQNISNPIVTIDTTVQFNLIISDGYCSDTLKQLVFVDSISVNTSKDTTFCKDSIQVFANTTGNINSIIWSNFNNFSDTISSDLNYKTNNIGTYFVKVENDFCTNIDSVKIYNDNIIIALSGIGEICYGDSIFIKADDLSPLEPIVKYEWESNYLMIFNRDSSSFISYPQGSSYYSLTATNTLGCIIKDSIYVNVYAYPIYDSIWSNNYTIFYGQETDLNISTFDNFIWSIGSSEKNTIIMPQQSTWYSINIYNKFCSLIDSLHINVLDVFCDQSKIIIPTAFSPNDDQINDFYYIIDNDNIITKFKLEIFNRFGEKVYSSNKIEEKWDGYHKSSILTPQTLDYYLDVECYGGKSLFKKGNITIVK